MELEPFAIKQQPENQAKDSVDFVVVYDTIKNILNCAKHTHLLLQAFVDFSHMDTEKFSLNIKKVNVTKIINEVIGMYNFQVSEKEIDIVINIDNELKSVKNWETDEIRLKIIFSNLIHNALKFTNHGGIVTISIQESKLDSENYLYVQVNDNGCGINDQALREIQKSILNPLKNFSESPTAGIGLGLRFVSCLLKYLGRNQPGTELEISSILNKETTCAFYLRNIDPNDIYEADDHISKVNSNMHRDWVTSTLIKDTFSRKSESGKNCRISGRDSGLSKWKISPTKVSSVQSKSTLKKMHQISLDSGGSVND